MSNLIKKLSEIIRIKLINNAIKNSNKIKIALKNYNVRISKNTQKKITNFIKYRVIIIFIKI